MRKVSLAILSTIMFISSCQHDPPQGGTNLPYWLTNDLTGAIGGVEIAIQIGGVPTNQAQAACYALWGVWTGLSASGNIGNRFEKWGNETAGNLDIQTINARALQYYNPSDTQYVYLGKIHNEILHQWVSSPNSYAFDDNTSTNTIISNYYIESPIIANRASSCMIASRMNELPSFTDSLTRIGIKHVQYPIDSKTDVLNAFNTIETIYPTMKPAVDIIKNITNTAWTYAETGQNDDLQQYLKTEIGKINRFEYNIDYSNQAILIAMGNIFVYSYSYRDVFTNQ